MIRHDNFNYKTLNDFNIFNDMIDVSRGTWKQRQLLVFVKSIHSAEEFLSQYPQRLTGLRYGHKSILARQNC